MELGECVELCQSYQHTCRWYIATSLVLYLSVMRDHTRITKKFHVPSCLNVFAKFWSLLIKIWTVCTCNVSLHVMLAYM